MEIKENESDLTIIKINLDTKLQKYFFGSKT